MTSELECNNYRDLNFADARRTAAIFAAIAASTLVCVYYLLRLGFPDNSITPLLEVLGLSFFILLLPAGFRLVWIALGSGVKTTWLSSDAAISLFGLALITLSGTLRAASGINLLLLFVLFGFTLFAVVLFAWLRKGALTANVFFLVGGILFSVWAAGAIYGSGYQNPLFEEAVTAGFYLCKDVLLTSAFSNIIKTYQFPSTGLDGLPYCFYHWGSYWIFAQMSNLLNLSALKFNQLAYPVIFVPFLLARLLSLAIDIRARLVAPVVPWSMRNDWLFWVLFATAYIGFIPGEVAAKMAMGTAISFISESYAVGLAFSFPVLSLAVGLLGAWNTRDQQLRLSAADHILILILPLLIVVVGFVKISLMYLLVVILGYLFLRLRLWKHTTSVISLLIAMVCLPVVTKLTTTSTGAGFDYIYPFAFFISNVSFAWKPFFFIFYYFWSWVFIVCKLYFEKVATWHDLKGAVRDRRILDVEVMVVTCLAGAAPGFILPIGGGSAAYFSDFQTWLALSLLLASLDAFRKGFGAGSSIREESRFKVSSVQLKHLVVVFVGACLIGSVLANGVLAVWRMAYLNLTIRAALVDPAAGSDSWRFSEGELYKRVVKIIKARDVGGAKQLAGELRPFYVDAGENLERAKNVKLMGILRKLAELPMSEKRKTAIFVPQSNKLYWDSYASCEAVPLLVPAITGMAMIDGMPPADCRIVYTNHYAVYQLRKSEQTLRAADRAGLCAYARSKGFSQAIVVNSDYDATPNANKGSCP